ncbi:MAG TPA: hypothetical protein VLK33_15790, partial [Terriglobales bacterium]|nr:hypothetical protein [Terriglobales bacterium]
ATAAVPKEIGELAEVAGRLQAQTKQTTQTINRLHNLLARVFPELANVTKDFAAAWVLEPYTFPMDSIDSSGGAFFEQAKVTDGAGNYIIVGSLEDNADDNAVHGVKVVPPPITVVGEKIALDAPAGTEIATFSLKMAAPAYDWANCLTSATLADGTPVSVYVSGKPGGPFGIYLKNGLNNQTGMVQYINLKEGLDEEDMERTVVAQQAAQVKTNIYMEKWDSRIADAKTKQTGVQFFGPTIRVIYEATGNAGNLANFKFVRQMQETLWEGNNGVMKEVKKSKGWEADGPNPLSDANTQNANGWTYRNLDAPTYAFAAQFLPAKKVVDYRFLVQDRNGKTVAEATTGEIVIDIDKNGKVSVGGPGYKPNATFQVNRTPQGLQFQITPTK